VTTLLLVGSAVAVYLIPGASALLIFDRAAIGDGEWWRVVTGSWVHLSISHLAYDGVAVLIAGWLLERYGAPLRSIVMASAIAVGLAVLFGLPEIARYGGLSGIAYALVAYLALSGLAERGAWRWLCATTLLVLVAKLAYELSTGRFLLVPTGDEIVAVPLAHAVGMTVAGVAFSITRTGRRAFRRHASSSMFSSLPVVPEP
jgi:rhomboid family GlyGly-CTERM serine protease